VTTDPEGRVVFCDQSYNLIRRVNRDGTIETIAGTGGHGDPDDGRRATEVKIQCGGRLRYDANGNLYFQNYSRLRRLSAEGILSTVAGNGQYGDLGDGGPAVAAQLENGDFAFDAKGNIYVLDPIYQRVRRIRTDGTIEAYAGISTQNYCNSPQVCDASTGPALLARFYGPSLIAVDPAGNVFVVEVAAAARTRIRKITPSGIVSVYTDMDSPVAK
jgi:hypothetical protein